MKTKTAKMLMLSASTLLLDGCFKDQSQDYASCEQQAYTQIGVQSYQTASTSFSLKKGELVRVCMVKNGYSFLGQQFKEEYEAQYENVHKKYRVWDVPGNDLSHKAEFNQAAIELAQWDAANRNASRFWK